MATHQQVVSQSANGVGPPPGPSASATSPMLPGPYKRASRKGAPRRFGCDYPGCDKIYSRAEHLQRHQLNHAPKEIFQCDVAGCDQKFVRADLLARHRKRHSSSYIPRNRMPSFSSVKEASSPTGPDTAVLSPTAGVESRPPFASVPHDAAILLAPDPRNHPPPTLPSPVAPRMPVHHSRWPPQMPDLDVCAKPGYYVREAPRLAEQQAPPPTTFHHNVEFQPDEVSRENFTMWLFNPQAPYSEFPVSHLPFMDGGLESALNNNIHYDYESLTSSRSQLETPPRLLESDELLNEFRRREILNWFHNTRDKQPKYRPLVANIAIDGNGDMPALSLEVLRECLQEYWENVSPRLPIVHQPTFSCNRCSLFLVMVMIALGAASLHGRDASGSYSNLGGFADVVILGVRWDIVTAEEASPPVGLWVAQALLLLELYEKMYSSRHLHERAHIYHTVALTLLRRGSPLIGRSGSESPPEVPLADSAGLDSRTWWCRWAETEAMHRVVYAAFMMDIVHAAMFGHAADMAPHEIRLPLPCDDNLWTASNPDTVRQLDQNLRMYGVKNISFLDGLKRALHGKEVKTHSFARMIIMSGLLSVGWHLSHRETHLKWLDLTAAPTETQESWKKTLLRAFDDWKYSFDAAQATSVSPIVAGPTGHHSGSNGPIQSAAVLYHLAQISLHVDIVDCQVYAGAKRLLGRKVSVRDYSNVVVRMKYWATQASTRHAVWHAFKLLHRVLVDPRRGSSIAERERGDGAGGANLPPVEFPSYSCRNETDPHRPWVMYYAALCIWSYFRAVSRHDSLQEPNIHPHSRPIKPSVTSYRRVMMYLSSIASAPELTETAVMSLGDGLSDLLDVLHFTFSEARSELLQEAHQRLKVCREMLVTVPG